MTLTAVEWLIKMLHSPVCNRYIKGGRMAIPQNIIEDAKAMEKEQIEDAFKQGVYEDWMTEINYLKCDDEAEYYYNQKYGQ